ncbi:OMR family iron-siderophore receptor [Klebsiella michiganensis]|nr:OMR family iron-siderophore receptor [Klebsiella michiganensis]
MITSAVPGWNSGKRKVDAVDLFAAGGYDLFGRQHNLMIGHQLQ